MKWVTGKVWGSCDGVGGTAKRMADEEVKKGRVRIQDAPDFYQWASGSENSSLVSYRFYTKESKSTLKQLKPVKGDTKTARPYQIP